MIDIAYFAIGLGSILALLLTFLAIYPVGHFLILGWQIRREDVFSSLGEEAKAKYIETFLNLPIRRGTAGQEFERIYNCRYGKNNYYIPLLLLATTCGIATFLMATTAALQLLIHFGDTTAALTSLPAIELSVVSLPPVAALAVAGAYVWAVAELVFCSRRNDLVPSDILRAAIRLILAVPLAYAISTLFAPAIAPFLALAIGAFPLDELTAIVRTLGYQQLKLNQIPANAKNAVTNLDGVDQTIASRLQDEGITTILQLAYCDPVQLSMRTALSFDVVIDLVSQALAWNFIHEKLADLSKLGLRGSIEFWNVLDELNGEDAEEKKKALSVFTRAAEILGIDVLTFTNLCQEIAFDPYTLFLTSVLEFHGEQDEVPNKNGVIAFPPAA